MPGHHLGPAELGDLLVPVAGGPGLGAGERVGEAELAGGRVGPGERDRAHGLHATGDDEVRRPAHDGLRGVVDRLLAGAALAFDRGAGDVLGEPGREPGVARHVHGLRAELVDAAEDDLVVLGRVDVLAGDELAQRRGRQIEGMHAGEPLPSATHGGADGVDDVGLGHGGSSGRRGRDADHAIAWTSNDQECDGIRRGGAGVAEGAVSSTKAARGAPFRPRKRWGGRRLALVRTPCPGPTVRASGTHPCR